MAVPSRGDRTLRKRQNGPQCYFCSSRRAKKFAGERFYMSEKRYEQWHCPCGGVFWTGKNLSNPGTHDFIGGYGKIWFEEMDKLMKKILSDPKRVAGLKGVKAMLAMHAYINRKTKSH